MKSTHWIVAAALSVSATAVFAAGCKKEGASGDSSATSAPAPAEGTVERTAAVEAQAEIEPAAVGQDSAAEPEQGASEQEAAAKAGAASDKGSDVVAIGSGGKTKVSGGKAKVLADTATYSISLTAPAQLAKGADGSATLVIVPKTGWKLNQEFPTKLSVAAPAGVSVAKSEQKVADAVEFTEKSGTWAVKFKAESSGDKAFTGKVKFAVCTDTTCDPKKEELAWNVAVK